MAKELYVIGEIKVACDEELSDTSEKPVQNKVVKAALDKKMGQFKLAKNSDIDKMFK